ncbi:DUF1289 domain-containing protein [Methylobacterium sp. C25]|uniref:DUF1289 domain-containing protein n=1 Tax=Methylobacterium sp. C25 TaxID=2721622 RepID=UPI001F27BBF3|nr:DUF1289 domain-containing protein [Methylobacterium sp. C25]MCE4222710.1 DUF1289 domain-containing protein [Methylobacterium sp. C25]
MNAPPRPKPSSPCTKVCILDAVTGLCEGCGRSRNEIALWGSMSEPQRLAVMALLPERLRQAYPHRIDEGR